MWYTIKQCNFFEEQLIKLKFLFHDVFNVALYFDECNVACCDYDQGDCQLWVEKAKKYIKGSF